MVAPRYLGVVAVAMVIVGVAAYLPLVLAPGSGGTTSDNTTSVTSKSTSTSTTSSSSQARSIQAASYSYDPQSPVRVDSVSATTSSTPQGTVVTFYVAYENVGSGDIYYVSGCGSSLDANVTSGSAVIQTSSGGVVCECAEAIFTLPPGGNHTALTPGCWSRTHFLLVAPGTAQVGLTIHWGPTQANLQNDTTSVYATFTFA